MITLQYADPEFMIAWAARHLGVRKVSFGRHAKAIGVRRDGELVAVTVFDRFSATNAEISFVSDGSMRWMQRTGLRQVLQYPFVQLGLKRLTAVVAENNQDAIRTCLFLGFEPTPEATLIDALPGQNVLIFRMFRADCPWLPKTEARR